MIELLDVDCGCLGIVPGEKHPVTAEDLRQSMERLQIRRGLVRYAPIELSQSFFRRNDTLLDFAATDPGLLPCPAVAPASGYDIPSETVYLDELIQRGARAVTICPAHDSWLLEPFVYDRLFAALQERRMPVIAPASIVPFDKVAELAARFDHVPFVLVGVGYRSACVINALLEAYPNVYLSLGDNYTNQGAIEHMVPRYGADRFVFGTGFPKVDPAGAVTQLVYARISDEDKQQIGQGNMLRLLEEVAQ